MAPKVLGVSVSVAQMAFHAVRDCERYLMAGNNVLSSCLENQ